MARPTPTTGAGDRRGRVGSVYVAGQSASTGTFGDYVTIKYNAGTGVQEWASTYNGAGNYLDSATGMALDGTGNVYVAGYSIRNASMTPYLTTIKYNSSGTQQWVSHSEYPAGGWFTPAYISLSSVDASVLVAGSVTLGASADFGLMKYDTTDGSQEWARYYDGPVNGADTVVGLAVDSAGNAIITGSVTVATSGGELFDRDIAVRKYDAAGTLKWAASYGSSAWTNDDPAGVAVDADGNVFVAGNSPTWEGWATLKYDGESGDLEWITTYTGLDEGQEVAAAIAVSAAGAIHVTGMSSGDYATVKYVERSYRRCGLGDRHPGEPGSLRDQGHQHAGRHPDRTGGDHRQAVPGSRTAERREPDRRLEPALRLLHYFQQPVV